MVNAQRIELERAVLDVRGEITLTDAAVIQTACRFERHAQLASKWLRENPGLPVDIRLTISRDIAKASADRDRCIKLLRIDKPETNPWEQAFADALLPDPSDETPDEPDSSVAKESPLPPDSSRTGEPSSQNRSGDAADDSTGLTANDSVQHVSGCGAAVAPQTEGASCS
jgi:hypothetical protein